MPKAVAKLEVKNKRNLRSNDLQKSKVSAPVYSQVSEKIPVSLKNLKLNKFVIIALVVIALALLFTYKKNWIVAGSVNGGMISNFEVLSRLNSQYRTQILNQMVNEKIILQEAQKKNVSVTPKEIEDKIIALEKSVGGKETLDGLLAQQGQTRTGLQDQLKIQLIIEKLYANEATISASEVADFIVQNKGQFQATDSAEIQTEAENALKQQKLGQIFNEKFQQLKSSAKVTIY